MWMIVFFDLPVVEEEDRKAAAKFRNFLLDEGFNMSQFSVYLKLLSGKEAYETYLRHIKKALPPRGKVDILGVTDKQYENIISFYNHSVTEQKKIPTQLTLF